MPWEGRGWRKERDEGCLSLRLSLDRAMDLTTGVISYA
jgi:hypothetical protein